VTMKPYSMDTVPDVSPSKRSARAARSIRSIISGTVEKVADTEEASDIATHRPHLTKYVFSKLPGIAGLRGGRSLAGRPAAGS
jgi:hypothetical protein